MSVAGASIEPGDLVVGDADGVVVIAKQDVERIIALAAKKLDAETRRIAGIKQGDLRPGWLEGALRAAGMLAEGESL